MKKIFSLLLLVFAFIVTNAQNNINLIENSKNGYKKESLGDSVNSTDGELLPVISADGKTLIFCINGHPENVGGYGEDIWASKWNAKGYWQKAKNLGKPLNNDSNNSVFGFSPDGNSIFVMGEYNDDGSHKAGGVSVSTATANGWSVPQRLEIEDYYNDSHFANYCLSPAQNAIIMAVQRKESTGLSDLWVSFRETEFKWSKPLNMGAVLNSTQHEASPFLAADNKTLYFASNGHPGYGSFDLFVSKRLDDTWTNWSVPQNLGSEINTTKLEAFYTIPASGEYAYLVSEDNSIGGTDIFKIKLPQSAKPDPVILVYGKVSYTDGTPIDADIIYKEEGSTQEGIAKSNSSTGEYKIVLLSGKKYQITFTGATIVEKTEKIDATAYKEYTEIEKNYILAKKKVSSVADNSSEITSNTNSSTETNASGGIDNYKPTAVYFDYKLAELTTKAKAELDKLSDFLLKNATKKVSLFGHTDSKGENEANITLSNERTQAVKSYLEAKGIGANRISIQSFGEEKPAKSNDSDKGRALNRRVEINLAE